MRFASVTPKFIDVERHARRSGAFDIEGVQKSGSSQPDLDFVAYQ